MELKDRIRKAMEVAELTPTTLSVRAGVSGGAVTHWLNGSTRALKSETADRIAKATGFNARWLALGEGPEKGFNLANEAYVAGVLDHKPTEQDTESYEYQLAVLLNSVPEVRRTEAYLAAVQALVRFLPGA